MARSEDIAYLETISPSQHSLVRPDLPPARTPAHRLLSTAEDVTTDITSFHDTTLTQTTPTQTTSRPSSPLSFVTNRISRILSSSLEKLSTGGSKSETVFHVQLSDDTSLSTNEHHDMDNTELDRRSLTNDFRQDRQAGDRGALSPSELVSLCVRVVARKQCSTKHYFTTFSRCILLITAVGYNQIANTLCINGKTVLGE